MYHFCVQLCESTLSRAGPSRIDHSLLIKLKTRIWKRKHCVFFFTLCGKECWCEEPCFFFCAIFPSSIQHSVKYIIYLTRGCKIRPGNSDNHMLLVSHWRCVLRRSVSWIHLCLVRGQKLIQTSHIKTLSPKLYRGDIYKEVQNAVPFYLLVLCCNSALVQLLRKSGLYSRPYTACMHRNNVRCKVGRRLCWTRHHWTDLLMRISVLLWQSWIVFLFCCARVCVWVWVSEDSLFYCLFKSLWGDGVRERWPHW